jgi:hypothetical protein
VVKADIIMLGLQTRASDQTDSFACRPIRQGVKIEQLLEGIGAEHFAVSLAELWGLPVGKESMETVAGEI